MGRDLGWRRSPPDFQRQQGRRQRADGRPGQRRRGRRASKQENEAGVDRASPCTRQKKGRGSWAAANFAAQTRPAAAALALWPAPAITAWARIQPLQPYPEGRWTSARQCARRQPWCRPWSERAAKRRSARPLGPLVKVLRTVHSNGNRVIFLMEIFF
jgi:hypothetical protein